MSDVIVVMRDGRIQQQGGPRSSTSGRSTVRGRTSSACRTPLEATVEVVRRRDRHRAPSRRTAGSILAGTVTDPEPDPTAADRVTVASPARAARRAAPRAARRRPPGWTTVPGRIKQGTYLGDQTEYRIQTERRGRADRPPPERSGRGTARGSDRAIGSTSAGTRRPTSSWSQDDGRTRAGPGPTAPAGGGSARTTMADRDLDASHRRGCDAHKVSRRGFLRGHRPRPACSAFLAACGASSSSSDPVASASSGRRGGPSAAAVRGGIAQPPRRAVRRRRYGRPRELFMYNWADYVDPDNIETFKKDLRHRRVHVRHFALERGDDHEAPGRRDRPVRHRRADGRVRRRRMVAGNFIQKLDWSKLPNVAVHRPAVPGTSTSGDEPT